MPPNDLYLQLTNSTKNHFVFTSDSTGIFQKSGVSDFKILECFGSLVHFQCSDCGNVLKSFLASMPPNCLFCE